MTDEESDVDMAERREEEADVLEIAADENQRFHSVGKVLDYDIFDDAMAASAASMLNLRLKNEHADFNLSLNSQVGYVCVSSSSWPILILHGGHFANMFCCTMIFAMCWVSSEDNDTDTT